MLFPFLLYIRSLRIQSSVSSRLLFGYTHTHIMYAWVQYIYELVRSVHCANTRSGCVSMLMSINTRDQWDSVNITWLYTCFSLWMYEIKRDQLENIEIHISPAFPNSVYLNPARRYLSLPSGHLHGGYLRQRNTRSDPSSISVLSDKTKIRADETAATATACPRKRGIA